MADNERRRMWREASRYSSIGIEMTVGFAFGVLGGQWLDRYLQSGPWMQTLGILLGFILVTQSVLRGVRRYRREQR